MVELNGVQSEYDSLKFSFVSFAEMGICYMSVQQTGIPSSGNWLYKLKVEGKEDDTLSSLQLMV